MKIQFTPPPRKLLLLLITLVIKMQFANAQLTATLTTNNISCFGMQDGSITATATGGTPPYTYEWSNQETGPNITGLAAGYYRLTVKDDFGATGYAEVTLVEPEALQLEPDINVYSNGYNISCYNCFNGSITLNINGGTTPYTHLWNDGNTNKNRFGLAPGNHNVTVTDANGCEVNSESMYLNQPERSDWTMNGNSGSNPTTSFIGTTDNKDLKFRTNNIERLSLNANGDIKMSSLSGNGYQIVFADANGILTKALPTIGLAQPWMSYGNTTGNQEFIGTINNMPLVFKTNTQGVGVPEKMRIMPDGKVGIGTDNPQQQLEITHSDINFPKGGLNLNANFTTANAHSEIRFMKGAVEKWAIGNDIYANGGQDFFFWNHQNGTIPFMINGNNEVYVGGVEDDKIIPPPMIPTYKLFVFGGIAAREVKVTVNAFPDYVFEADYKPQTLQQLEDFIKQNKHLPEVPSAKEVAANDGIEVGKMQTLLLKKVEELTLYIIAQQKELDEVKAQLQTLKK
jgi:hypothetical protein